MNLSVRVIYSAASDAGRNLYDDKSTPQPGLNKSSTNHPFEITVFLQHLTFCLVLQKELFGKSRGDESSGVSVFALF